LLESPVPDKATCSGELKQLLFLFGGGFKSVSEGFVHTHILSQAKVEHVVSILGLKRTVARQALMFQG
jgi:hypothetical protein